MNKFEKLEQEAYENNITVKEVCLSSNSDGLYKKGKIALNKDRLNTKAEKICTLAEELSHHHYNFGDIIDDKDINNRKQEYKARLHAYDKLIGLRGLVNAFNAKCQSLYEIAEYLEVTPEFLAEALECYRSKYGKYAILDNYAIIFLKGYVEDKEGFGYKVCENLKF